jgi:hypothetical protein
MNGFMKTCYRLFHVMVTVGFGLSLIGCAKDDGSGSGIAASRKSAHDCQQTSAGCFSETVRPSAGSGPVDVLFVVQTSASIADVKPTIISGINDFIATLPAGSDFNIAVMLSHGSTSDRAGRLYQAGSEPVVLKSSELSNTDIQTYLDAKLANPPMDSPSGGGEEGVYSLFHGITTPALLSESQNAGFFRANAALGVVFIADRRDICAIVPPGVPPETDPLKIGARIRDCEGLTPAGLSNQLHVLKGSQPIIVSGILYSRDPAPAGKELGYGYIDVINLNNGVAIDIANDNIANGLSSIAQLGGSGSSTQNTFTLSHSGIDSKKIIVTVNGVGVNFTLSGDTVTITDDIPAGAEVVIAYCLKGTDDHHDHDDDDDYDHHHHHGDHDNDDCDDNKSNHHDNDYHHRDKDKNKKYW